MEINNLSDKQITAFQDSNSRINIFEGSVRAGKSFISLLRWLEFVRKGPAGPLIICGRTDRTIKRNIILPLQEMVGPAVQYHSGKGEVEMFGRKMYVVGANDERAEGKIRGSEFAGALIDELTILPESFFKMLLSRLSIEGAKIFATTNPDSPFHWVKRDLIDRKDELNLSVFSFNIDDNPALSEQYKNDLKKEYKGLWFNRFIEGKWVLAEGAVYDFFDTNLHVLEIPITTAHHYFVGIDYGTTNPCVFTMIGYDPNSYPNLWLEKEYYFDSKKEQRQKSDFEYTNDFIDFISGFNVKSIIIDPSAASFKRELQRNGISGIKDADNDVLKGIRFTSNMLSSGQFKVCASCKNTIKEFMTYVWDSKSSERGLDKPVKQNDHALDAIRYVLATEFFTKSSKESMTDADARRLEDRYAFNRFN